MVRRVLARVALSSALVVTVLTSTAAPALADTAAELQAKLDEANERLEELWVQAAEVNESVNQTQDDLSATAAEIEAKEAELSAAQDVLATHVSSSYKTGGVSLLSILFEATSFEDFLSRITYAAKVSESDANAVEQVRQIQAELDAKEAEQTQLLSELEERQTELEASAGEAEAYVSSLDEQVQAKLAEEQAALEAEQAAAQEAAMRAAEQNEGNYVTEQVNETEDQEEEQGQEQEQQEETSASQGASTAVSDSSSSGSGLTSAQRNAIVSAAWSKVGCAYVYGGNGPSSFDCSGFTSWCYAQAGISLPRSSYSQGSWGSSTSNPQPGDIICWGGHVGIYISSGMMIDAGNEGTGVIYRAIYGSPWYRTL